MKKIFSVRGVLVVLLLLTTFFSVWATYYKINYWGFSLNPNKETDVWTVDAHISFEPTGDDIEVSLSIPSISEEYRILSEDVVAPGYDVVKDDEKHRLRLFSKAQELKQDLYYRVMIYDNKESDAVVKNYEQDEIKIEEPKFSDELQEGMVNEIWNLANEYEGSDASKIIKLLNEKPLKPQVDSFLPIHKNQRIMADSIIYLLSVKGIPARVVRGIKLTEKRKSAKADLMIEVFEKKKWKVYNIENGKSGLPKNFILFQRGGVSLLDVVGGEKSKVKFSVLKSVVSSFKMAGRRAKYAESKLFDYTIYNLPMLEQNTLKWLMIFPLGILLVVLMRNVVGIRTMGTFTPMLIAMSLVKTGFGAGLVCFSLIIIMGLLIRSALTRLNLLLVPRISAVVICVILIIQMLTIFGYISNFVIASSAVFFPIIITAWIIERASITWEEEGAKNAFKQILNSVIVAIFTYFVISNENIRHIMFAFNEWNLVILFIIMLLGTYTGYRLTELKRFAPLLKD